MSRASALALFVALALLASAPAAHADPVVAAAGDVACKTKNAKLNSCRQMATSDILVGMDPLDAVLALGDLQYECGELTHFQAYYDLSWGRVKDKTYPVPGNHEYETKGCSEPTTGGGDGYFSYFGDAATPREPGCVTSCAGYYSFDLGGWHIVALNSNCGEVRGCDAGSPQETWLRADLAATTQSCVLAYWHHPRYASNSRASSRMQPLWAGLYDGGADLVLSGHTHNYERFDRLGRGTAGSPEPALDPMGMRQFVVGTGGANHQPFGIPLTGSQVRNADTFGVLKLDLHPGSYEWEFVPEEGATFNESGSDTCHGGPRGLDSEAPSVPADVSATPVSPTQVDLSWSPATDNFGVTSYGIYRDGALIDTTTSTTFADRTAQRGTTYQYTVDAADAAGNRSPQSAPVTATTEVSFSKFRSAEVASNSRAATLAVSAPPGIEVGDVMLASIDVRGRPTITPPPGWTLIRTDANSAVMTQATYYRVVEPGEPPSYTWAFSARKAAAGGIAAYSGVDTAAPIDAAGGLVNSSSKLIKAPSITPTVPYTRLVGFFGIASQTTVTPPLGMTERGEAASTAAVDNVTLQIAGAAHAAAGPTGQRRAAAENSGPSIGHIVALRPAE